MDWQDLLFKFIGGLGIFLFGIKYMSDGLQKTAGDKMRGLLEKYTSNPVKGSHYWHYRYHFNSIFFRHNRFNRWIGKCWSDDLKTSDRDYYGGQHWNHCNSFYHRD